jgi:UPF0716 protein FxsA
LIKKNKPVMIFFLIFVIIPLTEIALFAWLGGEIGVMPTLLLCLLTAIIGAILIKVEGINTLFTAQKKMDKGAFPAKELFDGLCLVIAGVMLMTPGFFTDTMGFSLLIPPFRDFLRRTVPAMMGVSVPEQGYEEAYRAETIDVEFERVEESDEQDKDSS